MANLPPLSTAFPTWVPYVPGGAGPSTPDADDLNHIQQDILFLADKPGFVVQRNLGSSDLMGPTQAADGWGDFWWNHCPRMVGAWNPTAIVNQSFVSGGEHVFTCPSGAAGRYRLQASVTVQIPPINPGGWFDIAFFVNDTLQVGYDGRIFNVAGTSGTWATAHIDITEKLLVGQTIKLKVRNFSGQNVNFIESGWNPRCEVIWDSIA